MQPRTLLISQRKLSKDVLFRCPHYEFEDIICDIDSVDLIAPEAGRWFDQRYVVAKRLAWHTPLTLNPGIANIKIDRSYDLLFAICGSPVDLLAVNAIPDWDKLAKKSICLIDEMWVRELGGYKCYLNLLKKFDYVMLYYSATVDAINRLIGDRGRFLAPGIDALLFCPYPSLPKRVVDVYSIGRRSAVTHQALLNIARERGRFYLHDSISGSRAINGNEHRALFAAAAKRSRYFIVNPALVDLPNVRGGQNEIGNRYFEGAAAGAIMIGERPKNQKFDEMFDWQDAVLDLPFGSPEVETIMDEVESQPQWEEKMRRTNIIQTLLRHDWAYRWESVLKTAGLEPMKGLSDRKERLKNLVTQVQAAECLTTPTR
jgi:hypothetical protein